MKFTEKYPNEVLRALSWKQPYASLMLHGKIETRVWDSKYRGMVLICASKAAYNWNEILAISGEDQSKRIVKIMHNSDSGIITKNYIETNYPCGMAIAVGKLHTSIEMKLASPELNVENNCFVKYNPDLWMHIYTDVQPIIPFEWHGSQGWRTVDEETKSKIILL